MSVLDVGCFDGFYAFLAERRAAERVLAVDNEQYRLWVASRWGVKLEGGEGFRAVHGLLGSAVEYRRMDAFVLDQLEERFDLVYCLGILHRVENPLGLLRVLRGRTVRWRHGSGRDLRRRPGRSRRPGDPGHGTRGGLRARRLHLLGVRGRRNGAACQDRRLLARRVADQCGGRRPPSHHRQTDRIGGGCRDGVSTTSSQEGCSLATRTRARVARVEAVLLTRQAHPLWLPQNPACASFRLASPSEPARLGSVRRPGRTW